MTAVVLRSTLPAPSVGTGRRRSLPSTRARGSPSARAAHGAASPGGDCCVYCSYGTSKCPPMQAGTSQCSGVLIQSAPGCSESPRENVCDGKQYDWSSSERHRSHDGGAAMRSGAERWPSWTFGRRWNCALRGCDPKKMLNGGTSTVDQVRRMHANGVAGEVRIDGRR